MVALMKNISFDSGTVFIGREQVAFERRSLHGGYSVWVPREFVEDRGLVSNYTYLYSPGRSPLSIAIRFTPVSSAEDRRKMIQHHFSRGAGEANPLQALTEHIHYRDTLARGRDMSVYSLRFSVEADSGVLFGCFNCSGTDMDSWKPVALAMLEQICPDTK